MNSRLLENQMADSMKWFMAYMIPGFTMMIFHRLNKRNKQEEDNSKWQKEKIQEII